MKRIKIIYIAGVGNSGSTLLNNILASSKKCFSLGEVMSLKFCLEKYIPERYFQNRKLMCSCGTKFSECVFWSHIENVNPDKLCHPDINFFKKIKILISIFKKKNKLDEEEKLLYYLLKRAKNLKGENVEYLIDSSKHSVRLSYLISLKILIQRLSIFVEMVGVL